jgi:hypothetical protein
MGERHLRRILSAYLLYYHGARTHLSLEKDAPTPRRIHAPTEGRVVAFAEVVDFTIATNDAQPEVLSRS